MSLLNKADRAITAIETTGAWLLALLWISPLAYAVWAAVHPSAYSAHFILNAPLTVENFVSAWNAAPFARYFLNTFMLVTMILAAQLILCTLAAYAFARFDFYGRDFVFILVLIQLMIMPDVLIVENYRTMGALGIIDTIPAIGLPYMASAFGIFLLRQTFKTTLRRRTPSLSITTPLASNARTTLSTLPAWPRTGLAPDVSMRLIVDASTFARRANSTLVRPASALAALSIFPVGNINSLGISESTSPSPRPAGPT